MLSFLPIVAAAALLVVWPASSFIISSDRPPSAQRPTTCRWANNRVSMPTLPSEVIRYSKLPKAADVFTASTIPKGLLNQHSTKTGTWGVIRVSKGILEYRIYYDPPGTFVLDSATIGIIEPTVLHQVRPITRDVEFVVEFYRLPGTGPIDEVRQ